MMLLPLLLTATLWAAPADTTTRRCPANPSCTLAASPVRGTIAVDGRLDEADWQTAPVATGFRQFDPNEGAEPSLPTEVRVLYTASSLYVGALLHDEAPGEILQTLGRRDQFNQADWFIVSIDSYFDRKTAYQFAVNAAGVQVDGLYDGRLDESWDAVWESSARVTEAGWVVEMRIPYSMLRFPEADVQQWGINFRRRIPRFGETNEWVLVPRTELGGGAVAQFGLLTGLKNLRPRRNLQVTPYTLSRFRTEEGDPGQLARSGTVDVGGDVKVGLSSNVTLDATLNPDFGQVESDPAELNLSAFETFFPERRPFFTEGVQIFDFDLANGGRLLYTRRIGGSAPLIGATKLSGRTGSGLSFGLLGATSGDDFNPNRFYGVARLKQQVHSLSSVGGLLTATELGEGLDHLRSLTGGLDWDLRLRDNQYQVEGQASFTHRAFPGTGEDAATGFSVSSELSKIQGIWNASTGFTLISDDYNPNDAGRLRRADYMNVNGGVSHQFNGGNPFGPFRRASFRLSAGNGFSYREQLNLGMGAFFFSDWETNGFQSIDVNLFTDYLLGGYDTNETRGLGPRAQPREARIRASFETDARRFWKLEPQVTYQWFEGGGRSYGVSLEGDWNISPRLGLAAEVGINGEDGKTAWAANQLFAPAGTGWSILTEDGEPEFPEDAVFRPFDDGGLLHGVVPALTPYDDDGRYFVPVFGRRDTRAVDLTLRGSLTLSPTLSLQVYGQLFAARGRYDRHALLQDRDTLTPFPAYPKTHDFAFNSFQTNTVLRWEYRPGSTLFIVWSQSRNGEALLDAFDPLGRSPFDQRATDQLTDTFRVFPTNIFLVKLSYKFLR